MKMGLKQSKQSMDITSNPKKGGDADIITKMDRGGIYIHGLVTPVKDESHFEAQYAPVPLTEVQMNAKVVNFAAEVEVVQTYVNKENTPIEAIYIFPVEEEATVTHFIAKLDGREVKCVVKEKEEARAEYQEAITNKQTAFLLEETRPDIFQVKVGHLASNSKCEVKITYLTELPVEGAKTRLTIPTTIAPKYIPANDDSAVGKHVSKIKYNFNTPAPMTMHITGMMKTKIKDISSPSSHKIANSFEKKDSSGYFKSVTTLKGTSADMDKDIILLFDTEQPNEPRLDLEKGEDGSVVAMLSLVPQFELDDVKSEIIILVDCSGSMGGQSINLAKEALQLLLNSLPEDCYFNIFKFGSRYEALFPESKKYDDTTLEDAKRYAINMDANLGGTEVLPPLESIFNQKGIPGIPKQVFVLTDGDVSNSDACIKCVKKNSSTARVFTMGIGSAADRHLVKGMARAGNGTFVFSTVGEKIGPKVLQQLKHSIQPCISKVKVDWGDKESKKEEEKLEETKTRNSLIGHGKPKKENEELSEETQAPVIIPPVYDGSRLLLYKKFEKGEEPKWVKITAETRDGPLELEIKYEEEEIFEGKYIHCMFARKLIQDLEEGDYDTAGEVETKDLITQLGLKYGLASRHTSFIGVDSEKNKGEKVMITKQIKNQINQGYGGFDSEYDEEVAGFDYEYDEEEGECSDDSDDENYEKCSGELAPRSAKKSAPRSTPAPDAQESVVAETAQSDTQKLLKLTSLQVANGSFRKMEAVVEISGKSMEQIDDEADKENIDKDVWFAAVVVALIEQKFADDKDSWVMIVEKARKWIKRSGVNDEDVVKKAKKFIQ